MIFVWKSMLFSVNACNESLLSSVSFEVHPNKAMPCCTGQTIGRCLIELMRGLQALPRSCATAPRTSGEAS